MRAFVRAFAVTTILSTATALFAQQPTVRHGQVTIEAASNGLGTVLNGLKQQKDPVWVGYSVPVINKFSSEWNSGHIDYLEGKNDGNVNESEEVNKPFDHAVIFTEDCGWWRDEAARREPGARTRCRRAAIRLVERHPTRGQRTRFD
jgi:hypothetical protein